MQKLLNILTQNYYCKLNMETQENRTHIFQIKTPNMEAIVLSQN